MKIHQNSEFKVISLLSSEKSNGDASSSHSYKGVPIQKLLILNIGIDLNRYYLQGQGRGCEKGASKSFLRFAANAGGL